MMTGFIYFGHALIEIDFLRHNGGIIPIEFVIDTGFTWYVTLPPSDIAALGLPYKGEISVDLADESSAKAGIYTDALLWHGQARRVPVLSVGDRPLLGLALLNENKVNIDFTENGTVTITPRPQSAA